MILAFAAAAAIAAAPQSTAPQSAASESATVRVNVEGLQPAAARAALNRAARRVCRAVNTDTDGYAWCVGDAARRAHADYQRLQQRSSLVVAARR